MGTIIIPRKINIQITPRKMMAISELESESILMQCKIKEKGKTTLQKDVFKIAKTMMNTLKKILKNMKLLREFTLLVRQPNRSKVVIRRQQLKENIRNLKTEIDKFHNTLKSLEDFECTFNRTADTYNSTQKCDWQNDHILIRFCVYIQEVAKTMKTLDELFQNVRLYKSTVGVKRILIKNIFAPPSA
ncbi:PREDICTED: uncharacterized protein LOC108565565 [Nicrophorus vespilloides]|uniref:Uncharacterized protein LOC108565565 n=1 Tax=Nicrophorus vespilloides TaxID=110193 RepID=A0ABM1N187_NICVS|nr:PREDICTED: uncharacterized protein LOC108565565 [Nicrophorus vespilloides]